jgi:hypothetical protein
MKLSILFVVTGLSVLVNTTRVVPGNTTPQVARADKTDPAATAVSDHDLVLDHARPDTGITVPPPGSFCLECGLWENDCKERCGGGRACKDFCKCERARRKPYRYSGMFLFTVLWCQLTSEQDVKARSPGTAPTSRAL